MFERVLIRVALACNDPSNGAFAEQLDGLNVGPNMHFDGLHERAPRLRYIVGTEREMPIVRAISIAGRHFPVSNYRPWFGNWCCDAFDMEGRYVLELLNWPRLRKWFDMSEGESRLFNYWKAAGVWKDEDLPLISKDFERLHPPQGDDRGPHG